MGNRSRPAQPPASNPRTPGNPPRQHQSLQGPTALGPQPRPAWDPSTHVEKPDASSSVVVSSDDRVLDLVLDKAREADKALSRALKGVAPNQREVRQVVVHSGEELARCWKLLKTSRMRGAVAKAYWASPGCMEQFEQRVRQALDNLCRKARTVSGGEVQELSAATAQLHIAVAEFEVAVHGVLCQCETLSHAAAACCVIINTTQHYVVELNPLAGSYLSKNLTSLGCELILNDGSSLNSRLPTSIRKYGSTLRHQVNRLSTLPATTVAALPSEAAGDLHALKRQLVGLSSEELVAVLMDTTRQDGDDMPAGLSLLSRVGIFALCEVQQWQHVQREHGISGNLMSLLPGAAAEAEFVIDLAIRTLQSQTSFLAAVEGVKLGHAHMPGQTSFQTALAAACCADAVIAGVQVLSAACAALGLSSHPGVVEAIRTFERVRDERRREHRLLVVDSKQDKVMGQVAEVASRQQQGEQQLQANQTELLRLLGEMSKSLVALEQQTAANTALLAQQQNPAVLTAAGVVDGVASGAAGAQEANSVGSQPAPVPSSSRDPAGQATASAAVSCTTARSQESTLLPSAVLTSLRTWKARRRWAHSQRPPRCRRWALQAAWRGCAWNLAALTCWAQTPTARCSLLARCQTCSRRRNCGGSARSGVPAPAAV